MKWEGSLHFTFTGDFLLGKSIDHARCNTNLANAYPSYSFHFMEVWTWESLAKAGFCDQNSGCQW